MLFSLFLSICRPARLELFLIVYRHLVSLTLLLLTLTTTNENTEGDRERKTRGDLSLLFFVLFLYPESFIHNLFFLALSLSPFWLLSIKYYPEATTRDEEQEKTQHHTDCFD